MKILLSLSLLLSFAPVAMAESTLESRYQALQQEYKHKALVRKFYTAFAKHDGATMASCYHREAKFYDPVFGSLNAKETKAMWKMLLSSASSLKVSHKNIVTNPLSGEADWEAWYPFSATGNKVHNKIHAQFEFKDGLIYRHVDHFDLHKWSSMALGPIGSLLGGTALVQDKIKATARERLEAYLKANP